MATKTTINKIRTIIFHMCCVSSVNAGGIRVSGLYVVMSHTELHIIPLLGKAVIHRMLLYWTVRYDRRAKQHTVATNTV